MAFNWSPGRPLIAHGPKSVVRTMMGAGHESRSCLNGLGSRGPFRSPWHAALLVLDGLWICCGFRSIEYFVTNGRSLA